VRIVAGRSVAVRVRPTGKLDGPVRACLQVITQPAYRQSHLMLFECNTNTGQPEWPFLELLRYSKDREFL
jgi:hypothetical protein